jgi:UDP-N-acetylglucosamine 2-epimerase (non-hydrolysing)
MIHVILGTKAQLVKMAPVMARLAERGVPYNFIFTGQHLATTLEMLQEFGLAEPNVRLHEGGDVVSLPQTARWLGGALWRSLRRRHEIFQGDRRGIVLVHGDTLSTLLGAVMGRLAGHRVAHVEAGLRSFDLLHPFPEELTRLAVFRLSHVLFCPGPWAARNVARLRCERIDTGANTLVDTLQLAMQRAGDSRQGGDSHHVPEEPFGLVSLHRYENVFRRERFERILGLLERAAGTRRLLFILHPPTARQLRRYGLEARLQSNERIEIRPRYTYFAFVALLRRAAFVITDGGSIQEESSYLGLPCLLMRRATERVEGIGDNVVLCDYDASVVDDFVREPDRYRHEPALGGHSPSDVIVDWLVHNA